MELTERSDGTYTDGTQTYDGLGDSQSHMSDFFSQRNRTGMETDIDEPETDMDEPEIPYNRKDNL